MDEILTHPEQAHARAQREKAPTFWKAVLFLAFLLLMAFAVALFVLSQRSETGPLVASEPPDAITVRVSPVELQTSLLLEESFTGLATPRRTSMLGFQSGGRIDEVRVDIGSTVEGGQTLAVLDTRSLGAQLMAADATVRELEASRDLAATTVRRQNILLGKGHVSQQAVDQAQAEVDAANARINAGQARADTLKVQIDLAQITAPFAGVVTNRMSDEGAIAVPGVPILELVESGHLEARIGLPADEAMALTVGEAYKLETNAGEVSATLRALTGVIDVNARTVTTVFDITDLRVPAGSVVRLALNTELAERGIWVPIGALTEGNRGLWSVYVAEAENDRWTAQQRPVEIVRAESDRAYVRGALSDGDMVITEGIARLSAGMFVAPSEQELAETLQ